MKTLRIHRLLLWVSLVLAAGSAGGFAWMDGKFERSRQKLPAAGETRAYVSKLEASPGVAPARWAAPSPQSRGEEWIYDVFTPPEIFYDPQLAEFVVTPPGGRVEMAAAPGPLAGIELLSVRRALFPLQLRGYVGDGEHLFGSFENGRTGETLLARAGQKLPTLNLAITRLAVQRRSAIDADTSGANMAVATVRDERTGETTTLNSLEPATTDELIATLAWAGGAESDDEETRRELREGDVFSVSGRTYRIERLALDPSTAEVVEKAPRVAGAKRWELTARPPEPRQPTGPAK